MIKKFDCVKFQRARRTKLSKLLLGMSPEEILRHFAIEAPQKKKTKTVARSIST